MNKLAIFGWDILCTVMPKTAVKLQYKHIMGKELDLDNPKDLNEKINYLKFHADLDEWARLADKYAVREYVKERGLDAILVNLYGKYDTPQALIDDWNRLPQSFVIKANNGCGTVKIVNNKSSIILSDLKKELEGWLKVKYGRGTMERHYLRIKPCLIVEEMLEEEGRMSLTDYKIWCFNGNPYCILTIMDRDVIHHLTHRSMYDLNWRRLPDALPHNKTYSEEEIPKPKNFEKMIECARILSKGQKEVRVDLYNINGRVLFGEMTLTARGGYSHYSNDFLLELGNQFDV